MNDTPQSNGQADEKPFFIKDGSRTKQILAKVTRERAEEILLSLEIQSGTAWGLEEAKQRFIAMRSKAGKAS